MLFDFVVVDDSILLTIETIIIPYKFYTWSNHSSPLAWRTPRCTRPSRSPLCRSNLERNFSYRSWFRFYFCTSQDTRSRNTCTPRSPRTDYLKTTKSDLLARQGRYLLGHSSSLTHWPVHCSLTRPFLQKQPSTHCSEQNSLLGFSHVGGFAGPQRSYTSFSGHSVAEKFCGITFVCFLKYRVVRCYHPLCCAYQGWCQVCRSRGLCRLSPFRFAGVARVSLRRGRRFYISCFLSWDCLVNDAIVECVLDVPFIGLSLFLRLKETDIKFK